MDGYVSKQEVLDIINNKYLIPETKYRNLVALEPVYKWFKVSERLPKDDGLVLVTLNGKWKACTFDSGLTIGEHYKGEGWYLPEYPAMNVVEAARLVTAWCELPEGVEE